MVEDGIFEGESWAGWVWRYLPTCRIGHEKCAKWEHNDWICTVNPLRTDYANRLGECAFLPIEKTTTVPKKRLGQQKQRKSKE